MLDRPAFEPGLRLARPPEILALATKAGAPDDTVRSGRYQAWERIAARCSPHNELEHVGASSLVLDPARDSEVIADLAADPGWQVRAADTTAAVFVCR